VPRALLSLAAARDCPACNGERNLELPWCARCEAVRGEAPPLDDLDGVPLACAARYTAPVPEAVQRFKYAGDVSLARTFSRLLVPCAAPFCDAGTALVPVPIHPTRLAERGYNQSALMARALGGALGIPTHARLLARQRAGRSQAGSDRATRQAVLDGVFQVRRVPEPRPARFILVDDVVTTGATARACLNALRGAGLEVAAIVAIARAGRHRAGSEPEARIAAASAAIVQQFRALDPA
jgi:ComF family protein